jgi:hypothetical protein
VKEKKNNFFFIFFVFIISQVDYFQSFVLAGCLDTWEIIGVVKFISLFTLNFFVIEQYSNDHLDFVKRICCTGIRVAYGG